MMDKLFTALIMLAMNIGGRFIVMDLPQSIDQIFTSSAIMRSFVIFALFFSATQDIRYSIIFTLIFIIVMKYLLNCDSEFCLLNKEHFKSQSQSEDKEDGSKKIREEDYIKAKRIVESYIDQTYHKLA